MTNNQVIDAWAAGRWGRSGNLWADADGSLWSYGLVIGYRGAEGLVVIDYRRPDHFRSMTTSHHVSAAARAASRVVTPGAAFGTAIPEVEPTVESSGDRARDYFRVGAWTNGGGS